MRVIAIKAWYENECFQADFKDNEELVAWWRSLPDDGAQAFRLWFDQKMGPMRLGRITSGNSWYFILATDDPAIDGYDGPLQELMARYPSAIAKRGKLIGERRNAEIFEEVAAAKYWNDTDEYMPCMTCGGA